MKKKKKKNQRQTLVSIEGKFVCFFFFATNANRT